MSTTTQAASAVTFGQTLGRRLLAGVRRVELALLPAIALAVVVGTIVNDRFLTTENLTNVLQQSSVLAIVVVAEAIVLIVGRFDLSLESIVGLAPMLGGWLITSHTVGGSGWEWSPALGIVACLVAGALVGAFNGLLVVKLRLNAFIVTLAVLILLRGITLGMTSGETLYDLPSAFLYIGAASWLGIPVSVWLAAFLFLVADLLLRRHRAGRAVYAVGGNAEAARAAGIRVDRVVLACFVLAGTLAALAGLVYSGFIASVPANQGQNLIFTVFAASVIGGISLNGGRGSMLGALSGVLLLGIIQNILTLSQIASFWINASFGAIILIALVLARLTTGEAQE